jgi:peptide-methionine (R)-S-oxide reductase
VRGLPRLSAALRQHEGGGSRVTDVDTVSQRSRDEPHDAFRARDPMKTDDEWKQALTPMQYAVLREGHTERAFTGEHWNRRDDGTYVCAGCGTELFTSADKFDSGCGWPSYTRAIAEGRIEEREDRSHGRVRTEVVCARCGGHLGHVFDDGPAPGGLRYCINSASLNFQKASGA